MKKLILIVFIFIFYGCHDDVLEPGSSFNVDGTNYWCSKTEAFRYSNSIHLYSDIQSVQNSKHIEISLMGSPVGSSVTGIAIGEYIISANNTLHYYVGSGTNQVTDYANSGKIIITSINNNYIRGTFDCMLEIYGVRINGVMSSILLE